MKHYIKLDLQDIDQESWKMGEGRYGKVCSTGGWRFTCIFAGGTVQSCRKPFLRSRMLETTYDPPSDGHCPWL